MSQASLDALQALVEAYNDADWSRPAGLLAPDCLYDDVGTGRQAVGARDMTAHWEGWKRAMPNAVGTVTSALDCGDTAIFEVTWNGTFTGPFARPTARSSRPAGVRPHAPASCPRFRTTRSNSAASTSTRWR